MSFCPACGFGKSPDLRIRNRYCLLNEKIRLVLCKNRSFFSIYVVVYGGVNMLSMTAIFFGLNRKIASVGIQ